LIFSGIDNSGDERKKYDEISSLNSLKNSFNDFIDDFNNDSKDKLNVVLFESAILHVNRILRILKISRGNMLMIGPSGSGKAVCTRLASYIYNSAYTATNMATDYNVAETWNTTIKSAILNAGINKRHASFLISDSHVDDTKMFEDIS